MTKQSCSYCGRADNHSGNNTVCDGRRKLYELPVNDELIDYVRTKKEFPEIRILTVNKKRR